MMVFRLCLDRLITFVITTTTNRLFATNRTTLNVAKSKCMKLPLGRSAIVTGSMIGPPIFCFVTIFDAWYGLSTDEISGLLWGFLQGGWPVWVYRHTIVANAIVVH
jgi:hypothetical protein